MNADMNDRNTIGQTPLHSAVEAGATDVVRLYVEKGADASAQDNDGRTPLHLAAEKDNNQDMIRLLLRNGAAGVNFQDAEGRTALHLAARKEDNEKAIELLLKHGADIYTCDQTGSPAFPHAEVQLESAVRRNNQEMVQLLLDRGVDGVKGEPSFGQKSLGLAASRRSI